MSLPRARELKDWTPEGYEKSIEELRREMGPELSDDDLLLKILIPGKPVKPSGKKKKTEPAASPTPAGTGGSAGPPSDFPTEFEVDVDGDLFNVKISPVWDGDGMTERASAAERPEKPKGPKELPSGALLCGMAGLVLSIEVEVGAQINKGDLVAVIEAMKMRRQVNSPHSGVVKEIRAGEGEIVDHEDILMVLE
jgi:biotin carboxyl carrier protein